MEMCPYSLTLLHSEWPKHHRVLAFLSATGLNTKQGVTPIEEFWPVSSISVDQLQDLTRSVQFANYMQQNFNGFNPDG